MPTRIVVLTEHQARLIEKLVSTGRYQNASEVLREGLRLIEDRDAQYSARFHALREAARVGVADIDAGRFRSFESPAARSRHLTAIADKTVRPRPRDMPSWKHRVARPLAIGGGAISSLILEDRNK